MTCPDGENQIQRESMALASGEGGTRRDDSLHAGALARTALGRAARPGAGRARTGLPVSPELLAHTSPLGWEHLLINGECRWLKGR